MTTETIASPIASGLRPGTVVTYTPDPSHPHPNHCRENVAIARADGRLVDTYWRTLSNAHVLTPVEVESAEALFHLDDFEEIDAYQKTSARWATYAPSDRRTIPSQHGLQHRWFIRKGASPDLATQIENARIRVADAEIRLASAQRDFERHCRDLDDLLATQADGQR